MTARVIARLIVTVRVAVTMAEIGMGKSNNVTERSTKRMRALPLRSIRDRSQNTRRVRKDSQNSNRDRKNVNGNIFKSRLVGKWGQSGWMHLVDAGGIACDGKLPAVCDIAAIFNK